VTSPDVDPNPDRSSDDVSDLLGSPPDGDGSGSHDDGRRRVPFWVEFPILIIVALGVAILIKTFLFQAFYIPSSSMEDTLNINDRVLVNKLTYRFGDIGHGDVIVFDDPRGGFEESPESVVSSAIRNVFESIGLATPRSEFIKRVIGLPGDTVEGIDGHVHVNGARLVEPYLKDPGYDIPPFGPVTVPPGQLFVMGDNRAASQDSRFFGTIPIDDVVGRAFVIIWPPAHWGGL
jgi:signal peptidase I